MRLNELLASGLGHRARSCYGCLALGVLISLVGCSGDSDSAPTNTPAQVKVNYTVSGTVSGLNGTVVLQDNGTDDLWLSANGPFSGPFNFATPLASGTAYSVTVVAQPVQQHCTVANGSGTVNAAVTNVAVSCTTNTYTVGGTVSGLQVGTLVLANGGDTVTVTPGMGSFTFPAPVAYGGTYAVTVKTQTGGEDCEVTTGGSGTVSGRVNDVTVVCSAWTWMSGSQSVDASGVYGTQGMAATTNVPGARYCANESTDSAGNFWVFGGYGYDATGGGGYLNDLWKFTPSTAQWTWISGSSSTYADGVYGTQGAPSGSNVPGSRECANTWTDSGGNFWVFGGYGYDGTGNGGYLNDLWEFSPSTGQWTWVTGSSATRASGIYGTQGTASASNAPGARYCASASTDSAGNFWLFGGYGYDATGNGGYLNDLWKFSPSTGQWTWVSGSSAVGASGVYGVQGAAAATNMPGARYCASAVTDSSGNLWLVAGYNSSGYFSDLWQYSPSTGQWTWVIGSAGVNGAGVYGTQRMAAATNVPGARYCASASRDSSGN
jgi:hypothetical protein